MEKININKIIEEANSRKEELMNNSGDKKEKPIDKLDLLIINCDLNNWEGVLKDVKKITAENPDLISEFFEIMNDQKRIYHSEKKKADEIINEQERLKELVKWDNKLRALANLAKAIDRRGADRDTEEE
ncbi:MAG: hypothetical protein M1155_00415 [Patescibacteria group bacterium]|nr:hypothetical protein [Patescibacteria group bacterium]